LFIQKYLEIKSLISPGLLAMALLNAALSAAFQEFGTVILCIGLQVPIQTG
jgi:hypothetical protein